MRHAWHGPTAHGGLIGELYRHVGEAIVVEVTFWTVADFRPKVGLDLRMLFQIEVQLAKDNAGNFGMCLCRHFLHNLPVYQFVQAVPVGGKELVKALSRHEFVLNGHRPSLGDIPASSREQHLEHAWWLKKCCGSR